MNLKTSPHLSFEDLLIALTSMDPHCPHNKSRLDLIYRCYDFVRYSNENDLREIFEDIHRNESKEVIDRMVAEYMADKENSSEGLTYNDFEKGVISGTIEGTDRLLRLKFPLFRRIGCGRKKSGSLISSTMNTLILISCLKFKLNKQNINI